MYAEDITGSMHRAIQETNRRRKLQSEFNELHGITPATVQKAVRDVMESKKVAETKAHYNVRRDVPADLPLDKLMAETDCPYLSPEPVRGTRNNPANVKFVIQKLASIKGVSVEDMCEANINNAKRLYNI
jgi:hypothetical protein